jgi:type IV secretory pathway VirB2 component (pilin)
VELLDYLVVADGAGSSATGGWMRRLSRTNNLRLGIILTVTGIIALAHALLSTSNHLGARPTFVIGIVLVVLGLPFLVTALRSYSEAE